MSTKKYTVLLIILLTYLALIYSYQIYRGSENVLYTDYGKFYQSVQLYHTNKNLYNIVYIEPTTPSKHQAADIKQLTSTLNPPFFALLTYPLKYLSYVTAYWTWSILSIAAGIISVLLLQKQLFSDSSKQMSLLLIVFFFTYLPTFVNTGFGQVSLLLLPILVLAWLAARNRYSILAGILLGILTALKIIFGIFFIYFLMRREWRALFCFIATTLLCMLLVIPVFGFENYVNYYHTMQNIAWYSSSWNAGIYGVLVRLFGGGELNMPLIHWPQLTHKIYWILIIGLIIGLLGFLSFVKNKFSNVPTIKCDLDFSCVIVTMLLISPLGWLYYFTWLIIPYFTIITIIQSTKQPSNTFNLHIILAAAIALSGIPHILLDAANITAQNVAPIFVLSSFYCATLIITLGVLYYLRHTETCQTQQNTLGYTHFFIYGFALLQSLFGIEYLINGHTTFGMYHYMRVSGGF